ncbi:tyrosine-type recombinase/integrase [Rhodanobacter sp. BL-MT-08]
MGLTARALANLENGSWLTEPGNRNEGALRAKGSEHGARFYYRYRDSKGSYDDLPIGSFDLHGKRGLSLEQARAKVRDLRTRYMAGERDLRRALESQQRSDVLQRSAEDEQKGLLETRARATLGALLAAYVEQLKRDGKSSAHAVETAVMRHVEIPWPKLWNTPAADVSAEDLLSMIARVANAGTLREAAKLRSYLRAGYGAAIRARQDARGLAALRDLKITSNPARDLVTVEGASKARDRALSVAELRSYWRRIQGIEGIDGAVLRFHLLTGAQRIEQLGRVIVDDYDTDMQCLRLLDPKGRRKTPRAHDVPLIEEALLAMNDMVALPPKPEDPKGSKKIRLGRLGPFVFTVTHGQSGAGYSSVQDRLLPVVNAMKAAGELEKGNFTLGDLRRSVETRLAAEGVSSDTRGQLQSHGLGGVQKRHYDRYEYLKEKRDALDVLYRLLSGKRRRAETKMRKIR